MPAIGCGGFSVKDASFRPQPSSVEAERRMKRQKRRDTAIEVAIRQRLHAMGLRFRVDYKVLPGSRSRHDIVFTRAKVAVDVHGCFWHSCAIHGTKPKANGAWWEEKLRANQERDDRNDRLLKEAGWQHVVAWEHEDPDVVVTRVLHVLAPPAQPA